MGTVISVIVGALLAAGAAFGLVNTAGGGAPDPVTAPYIVYGAS